MDIFGHTSIQLILFFILSGLTGAMPFFAAIYLLLRRGNAFAPGITPPVRLRRWAASFFAAAALGHVWWMLFYFYSHDIHSAAYVVVVLIDCVSLLITITGTLLAMLQDRRRPMWPIFVAMMPYLLFGGVQIIYPHDFIMYIGTAYALLLYVLFTGYMVVSVRRYGRWLNDNYADLENKKVWLSQLVILVCMLLFIIYSLVTDIVLFYLLHVVELVLFSLLLWRVETLPQLENKTEVTELSTPIHIRERLPGGEPSSGMEQGARSAVSIDLAQIEQLLAEHCVAPQLYLQYDLTLQQLAQAIGTNRYYLSQYFSRQGITYNTYINSQRVNHFIKRYEEIVKAGQSVSAQQLAHESGFRSYSTFSRAFMQRTEQTVTAWMRDMEG
jgi:AraC-like DNA-binding protein